MPTAALLSVCIGWAAAHTQACQLHVHYAMTESLGGLCVCALLQQQLVWCNLFALLYSDLGVVVAI
jgi:hypothetical protein